MNNVQKARARQIADWLDAGDELWEFVADAMDASRDKGLRARDEKGIPIDENSSYVLEDVIAALRAAS